MFQELFSFFPALQDNAAVLYWFLAVASILESLVFVGLLVPGTTLVIAAGVLAANGALTFAGVLWCVALGGIIGDALSFFAGRRGISFFQEQNRFFKRSYLAEAEQFFARHGDKSVALARFIGPIRSFVPFVAGLSRMRAGRFFFWNTVSAFVSAAAYVALGFFFGEVWQRVRHLRGGLEIAFLVVLIAVATALVSRKQKKLLLKQ